MSQTRMAPPRPAVLAPAGPAARISSIDILRALTMVLMIFVNDLWSLTNIPGWLDHVPAGVDGLGLADVVFPAFLFIVGLSIPFAQEARQQKGATGSAMVGHILLRSLALIVMGVYLVNGEYLNEAATGMPRLLWYALSCLAFIFIWNRYPSTTSHWVVRGSRALGIAVLLTLAIVYRSGTAEASTYFSTYWWGILGLIGWSYLASALACLLAAGRFWVLVAVWMGFVLLSMAHSAHLPFSATLTSLIPEAIGGGTLTAFTLGGAVVAYLFRRYRQPPYHVRLTGLLLGIALALFVLTALTRPYWGISKLGATTPWLFLCCALTILAFLVIFWLTDVGGLERGFRLIRPAGTDTLLCYLIPYFAYAFQELAGLHLPELVLTGGLGLLKSFLFALLCVQITGWLNRLGVRLKL